MLHFTHFVAHRRPRPRVQGRGWEGGKEWRKRKTASVKLAGRHGAAVPGHLSPSVLAHSYGGKTNTLVSAVFQNAESFHGTLQGGWEDAGTGHSGGFRLARAFGNSEQR